MSYNSNKHIEKNYDLLRIICAFSVVIIHVSATFVEAYTDATNSYREHIVTSLTYNTLSRFAVPCFFMLSGAFLLDKNENRNYKPFYKKTLTKIGVPTIVFTLLYFSNTELLAFSKHIKQNGGVTLFLAPIKSLLVGAPYYHMWYLFVLIEIYLFIPIIIRLKNDIGEKCFSRLSWVYLFVAICSGFTSEYDLNWSVSKSITYLGYVLIGYQIRNRAKNSIKKDIFKAFVYISLSSVLLLLVTYIRYLTIVEGRFDFGKYEIIGHFSPFIVVASLSMFAGFSYLSINIISFLRLSKATFLIYLFHAGIWNELSIFFKYVGITNPVYTIPLGVISTFLLSWLFSEMYQIIWDKIDKKARIADRLCKLFCLVDKA